MSRHVPPNNKANGIARCLWNWTKRYEARLASRRYEAVDPDNRLVAGELEARWNAALATVGEVEQRLRENELPANAGRILVEEIIADVDDAGSEIVLLIHWAEVDTPSFA